jgi:16S rRNA C1402 N4-methylase RsmH
MTREIIESILTTEEEAEKLIAKAKKTAQKIRLATDSEISSLKETLKKEMQSLEKASVTDIAEKSEREKEKVLRKTAVKLEKENELIKKKYNKLKKNLIQKIIK